jgi:hypothetical protein
MTIIINLVIINKRDLITSGSVEYNLRFVGQHLGEDCKRFRIKNVL